MKKQRSVKMRALVVCAIFFLSSYLSLGYIFSHEEHDCNETECNVCEHLSIAKKNIFHDKIWIENNEAPALHIYVLKNEKPVLMYVGQSKTGVGMKVRMNN